MCFAVRWPHERCCATCCICLIPCDGEGSDAGVGVAAWGEAGSAERRVGGRREAEKKRRGGEEGEEEGGGGERKGP